MEKAPMYRKYINVTIICYKSSINTCDKNNRKNLKLSDERYVAGLIVYVISASFFFYSSNVKYNIVNI